MSAFDTYYFGYPSGDPYDDEVEEVQRSAVVAEVSGSTLPLWAWEWFANTPCRECGLGRRTACDCPPF